MAFIKGVGRQLPLLHRVVAGHQQQARASQFLYGSPMAVPIPDMLRTDLLVMMGANPVVSHGSFLTAPARSRTACTTSSSAGDDVVVVDPRKTETAAQFEWLGIVPDSDAYFLLSLLQVMFAEGLVDRDRVGRRPTAWSGCKRSARRSHPKPPRR